MTVKIAVLTADRIEEKKGKGKRSAGEKANVEETTGAQFKKTLASILTKERRKRGRRGAPEEGKKKKGLGINLGGKSRKSGEGRARIETAKKGNNFCQKNGKNERKRHLARGFCRV